MNINIIAPESGDGSLKCKIAKWYMLDGSNVKPGDHVATLETEYASLDLKAANSGVLRHTILEGATVQFGEAIGVIEAVSM